jgi:hypothetical protein
MDRMLVLPYYSVISLSILASSLSILSINR